jgi:hypothetical protein
VAALAVMVYVRFEQQSHSWFAAVVFASLSALAIVISLVINRRMDLCVTHGHHRGTAALEEGASFWEDDLESSRRPRRALGGWRWGNRHQRSRGLMGDGRRGAGEKVGEEEDGDFFDAELGENRGWEVRRGAEGTSWPDC